MNPLGTFEATRELVTELCAGYPAPRVLDMGCGDGRLLVELAPRVERGFGVDRAADAVRRARRRAAGAPNLAFQVASAEELAAASAGGQGEATEPRGAVNAPPFDLVLFVGALEHMDRPLRALAAARALTHADGRVVVVAISPEAPHARISRRLLARSANPVTAHMSPGDLAALARGAGLEVDEIHPLARGSGLPLLGRPLRALLRAYDRVGGPTRAVVLRPGGAE